MAATPKRSFPAAEGDVAGGRARAVREMFSAIAPRYDLLNHLLSLNIDRSWRRRAVGRLGWETRPAGIYLDACAGTYDLALELARRPGFAGHVVAVDFAQPMLSQGKSKLGGFPVAPACADVLKLPVCAQSLDGAMVAFGLRNLGDIDAGLMELKRVLRDGARLVILDFAMPKGRLFKRIYRFYFTGLLPWIGRRISKHSYAYTYLPESVLAFARPQQLADRIRAAGFADVEWQTMTGGVACVWWATRIEATP